jgi:predicted hotdog family 3-hydroxylacyl-ACP dehydratase
MLGRAEIAERIPHGGAMCLLESVLDWDEQRIRCTATGHRDIDHPLREAGGLPVWVGIEYAAQSAAVHGALLRAEGGARGGVLGRVQAVVPACDWLDAIASPLVCEAQLLHRDPAGGIYAFEVSGDGKSVLKGRFTLLFTGEAGAAR